MLSLFLSVAKNPKAIKALIAGLAIAFLVAYGYHWGAGNIQAEWDKSAQIQRDLVQAERDRLQARADDASKAYQDYRKRTAQRMNTIKGDLAHEIDKTPSLRSCIANDGFLRLYNAASDVLPAPAS